VHLHLLLLLFLNFLALSLSSSFLCEGYDWDVTNNNAVPVMDDPNLHGYNVDAEVAG